MMGSWIDMLPPEVQTSYGITAGAFAVIGLLCWGAGIKIARPGAALMVAGFAALLAAWGLPTVTGISPMTAAIIGFGVGLLTGALTFRFLQGVLLAVFVGAVACGAYYRYQVVRT